MYINDQKSEVTAVLLTAESKKYDFNGNSGVSHKIRLSVNNEIIVCNSDEQQVADFKEFLGKSGKAVIQVLSRKESMSLRLISFVD